MIGGLLSLLSAVTFAYANASVRRGVLTGTVLQAVAISLPIALPFFIVAMLLSGGFSALAAFDTRTIVLLSLAGIVHFALARYCNYRATKAIGANLVAPVQQFSLVITLVLAIVWLGEALTPLRIIGILLVIAGPAFTLGPDKKAAAATAVAPDDAGPVKMFNPAYREGYLYSLLSALGFGISPILIGMAFETKGLAIGIAGGFVSYLAATGWSRWLCWCRRNAQLSHRRWRIRQMVFDFRRRRRSVADVPLHGAGDRAGVGGVADHAPVHGVPHLFRRLDQPASRSVRRPPDRRHR